MHLKVYHSLYLIDILILQNFVNPHLSAIHPSRLSKLFLFDINTVFLYVDKQTKISSNTHFQTICFANEGT